MPKFWHFRDGQTVFSSFAADWGNGYILTGLGEPVQLLGGNVTANYFDMLGMRPILGRNFLPEEEMKADVALVTEISGANVSTPIRQVARSQHYSERRADDDRRRAPEFADLLVWTRLRDFHGETVSNCPA